MNNDTLYQSIYDTLPLPSELCYIIRDFVEPYPTSMFLQIIEIVKKYSEQMRRDDEIAQIDKLRKICSRFLVNFVKNGKSYEEVKKNEKLNTALENFIYVCIKNVSLCIRCHYDLTCKELSKNENIKKEFYDVIKSELAKMEFIEY